MKHRKKVIVAMSGGVDSSVTAALLKEQGYDVAGLNMRLWKEEENSAPGAGNGKGAPDHAADVQRVAAALDIPLTVLDLRDEFYRRIVEPFCQTYFAGQTPNPCILCNQTLKFGLLLEKARELGGDFLATGHYARILQEGDRFVLAKGKNLHKDQSYFLFTLTQQQLGHVLFPLGEMDKARVREHAARFQLPVAQKAESQDICFIPDGNYVSFLERRGLPEQSEGEIVHLNGQVLGRHQGTFRYTIGQRRGLGIAWPEPLYVLKIDAPASRVIVGERIHLAVHELTLQGTIWNIPVPSEPLRARCRIRYRHREANALITPGPDGQARVLFDEPQQGVTPGQAAVFFDDDRILGGGWIL
ncbi:MAG: tRNA 2-thiouridine(34) synthase MnmA [Desulfuromonadales bacterium]|nr:tRNA 2-thiouridine(34) synthase MnmA [Desulfuromonadales bacterium]MDW7757861.1 tRNA 2-thiouridine(34) synthase MnmA [Desulfuromonadales bacterium]